MTIRLNGALAVLAVFLSLGIYAVLKYQNRNYAAEYFNFMPHEGVLESRIWHYEVFGCTYAIVSLSNTAPTEPPKQWADGLAWNETPMRFKEGDGCAHGPAKGFDRRAQVYRLVSVSF